MRNLDERSSKLIWIQQIDAKGNIPPKIMQTQIPRSLRPVFQIREKFNRDDEFDKLQRERLMEIMRSGYQDEVYNNDETTIINSVQSRMTAVPKDSFRPIDSPDFRTRMSIAHVEGESSAFMKCEVIIDASVEEVAAYQTIYTSRKRVNMNDRKDMLLRDATVINNRSQEHIMLKELGFG